MAEPKTDSKAGVANGVTTVHQDYAAFADRWRRCRDVIQGQDAVHKAGERYLPRLTDQSERDYRAYVSRATFFNATSRTLEAMTGMVFRRAPALTGIEGQLDDIREDATMSGVPLDTLAQSIIYEAMGLGRCALLVDYPPLPTDGLTIAQAQRLGARPFMATYQAEDIINWRYARVANRYQLVMCVLRETEEQPDGEFLSTRRNVYRVLRLEDGIYTQTVYRATGADTTLLTPGPKVVPQINGAPLTEIPLTIFGPYGPSVCVEDTPMIDLVNLNLSHYRTTADYEHGAHFCGLPTPVVSGYTKQEKDERLYVGSEHAWLFPRPETRAYYLEFGGSGLAALSTLREQKEQHMAALGARMLQTDQMRIETATTAMIHSAGELSVLGACAKGVSRGLTAALRIAAAWKGVGNADSIEYQLPTDYFPAPMDSATLTALVSAWQQGAISKETLFNNLKRGEVIEDGREFDEEEAAIGDEPPAVAHALAQAEGNASINAEFNPPDGGKKGEK